jgi:hypothetical protein
VIAVLSIAASAQSASPAQNVPIPLRVVWSFAHDGIVRFCYDRSPAIIYFKYDLARKVTSIKKKEFNGDERIIGEFPGTRDERSLSCSQDGQTIAAVSAGDIQSLFLLRGSDTALYRISGYWPFSNPGVYSLLAPDGKTIRLPKGLTLVAGTDLLGDMRVFPDSEYTVFFMDDYAYQNGESSAFKSSIYKIRYADGEWKRLQEIKVPIEFGVNEVARCGDHDVASLVGADSLGSMVLDEASAGKQDWLARIGARKLFRKYVDPRTITGGYGACAFPLATRSSRGAIAVGLARFDAHGLQIFSLPSPETRLVDDVFFSKDGCYALIQVAGPEVQLLQVESERCQ